MKCSAERRDTQIRERPQIVSLLYASSSRFLPLISRLFEVNKSKEFCLRNDPPPPQKKKRTKRKKEKGLAREREGEGEREAVRQIEREGMDGERGGRGR